MPDSGAPVLRNRPPLAIYRPVPTSPPESAGTGIGPMVRARLEVDAAGRVTAASILSVDPPGPFDAQFRREALRALRRWRFRPGLAEGEPAPAEVSISVRFEPRTAEPPGWRRLGLDLFELGSERERRRRSILALPEEARRILRDEIAKEAEALLDPPRRREASSEHFTLVSDLPAPEVTRLLDALESAWISGEEFLGPRIPLQPAPARILAFGFSDRSRYATLVSAVDPFDRTSGIYHTAGVIAAHVDPADAEAATVTLLHEAAHAFIDTRVVRPGVEFPRWLHEGLAMYVGWRQEPGAAGTKVRERAAPASARLKLADLIGSTTAVFHGDQHEQYYSDSWRAVHFLRHGGETWAGERFPLLILYLAEGYDFAESFSGAYGAGPAGLEEPFRVHAASL